MWSKLLKPKYFIRSSLIIAAASTPALLYHNDYFGAQQQFADDFGQNSTLPTYPLYQSPYDSKIHHSMIAVSRTMATKGIPGLSVGVTVNGQVAWTQGFGYSNVETSTQCLPQTVMRIASISKPITATIAARLYQEGLLDLDKDIHEYLPEFPKKLFNENEVKITMRQLLSHTGGIRHYHNKKTGNGNLEDPANNNTEVEEFLSNKPYKSVTHALEMFKDDNLVAEPGTKFSYTTHGLTLAAAVLEKVSGKTYPQLANGLFHELGLNNTTLDNSRKIVPERASFYRRNARHVLENCPEVDCSYKYAGGGILSNVFDLLTFANAILFSLKNYSDQSLISTEVLGEFLTKQVDVDSKTNVGLGWFIVPHKNYPGLEWKRYGGGYFYHTGAAVGASSVLLISPGLTVEHPQGISVVVLCNLQDTSVLDLAVEIEHIFREL